MKTEGVMVVRSPINNAPVGGSALQHRLQEELLLWHRRAEAHRGCGGPGGWSVSGWKGNGCILHGAMPHNINAR